MIRVLFANGNIMKRGGIEAFMMNYFRHVDSTQVHIDFLVHGYEKGAYDDEIINAGSKIYHVPTKSRHPFKYQRELKRLFNTEHFDVVHSNLDAMSGWILKIAKECGVPVRIAHSHNTDFLTTNKFKRIFNEYERRQIPKYATDLFACSKSAGEWLFGEKNKFTIIHNAIDIEKFSFNKEKRNAIRKQYGWEDKFVIGHVGRFDYQKNQEYLIKILPDIVKQNNNIHLVFAGAGQTLDDIRCLARANRVDEYCSFLGIRKDVADLYSAFDMFVLPSRFEGLAVVAVEAQANGLTCLFSDGITIETGICSNVHYISLNDKNKWIHEILKQDGTRLQENPSIIQQRGYSIQTESKKLEDFYFGEVYKQ